MFLVTFPVDSGNDLYLFFWSDPRRDSCTLPVVAGADFDEPQWSADEWRTGNGAPHVLARSNRSPLKFKAFRSELDVPNTWEILDGQAEVWSTWEAFQRSGA